MEARAVVRRVTPNFVRRLRGSAARQRNRLFAGRRLWRAGIGSEVRFWREWLSEGIAAGVPDVVRRLDPEAPCDDLMQSVLARFPGEELAILDVGAGPLTNLGKRFPGKRLRIVAVDPLAEEYSRMLVGLGVTPPVETRYGEAERLLEQFEPDAFQVAHSANALDHAYDPPRAITGMLTVVEPGGVVVLRHNVNEAEAQGYRGLHQWNFEARDGAFHVWNRAGRHDVSEALRGRAEIECRYESGRLICLIVKG